MYLMFSFLIGRGVHFLAAITDCLHVSAARKFGGYSIAGRFCEPRNAETQLDRFTFCSTHVSATSAFDGFIIVFLKYRHLIGTFKYERSSENHYKSRGFRL